MEVKTQSDECGATCRYELADALVMSQWSVSDEQKQPLIGLKWIQAMVFKNACELFEYEVSRAVIVGLD